VSAVQITPELIRIAWEQGRLGYRMRNSQKILRSCWLKTRERSRKFFVEATRRLGKSSWGLMMLAEDAIQTSAHREFFYAPVGNGLLDYIQPIIKDVFEDCPADLKPKFVAKEFKLLFRNDSEILFRAANLGQADRRRGNKANVAFIDEARDITDLKKLIESVVFPSLFDANDGDKDSGYLIISSTAADTTDHPLHEYRERALVEDWLASIDIEDAHKFDPTVFTRSRIDEWKSETDEISYLREYGCMWVRDGRLVLVPEWKKDFIREVPHSEFFPLLHKYLFLDVGVNDATSVLFAYYDFPNAKLVVEDEIWLTDEEVTTNNIVEMSKQKEKALGYDKMYRRIGDCAAKLTLQDLSSQGLAIGPCQKADLLSMVSKVRMEVNTGRVLVHPRCVKLIACLENGMWNKSHDAFAKSAALRHFDALAALMYGVRHIDITTNPIPADFGAHVTTHFITPEAQLSPNHKVLKAAFNLQKNVGVPSLLTDWKR
jgi:hypothetical protein